MPMCFGDIHRIESDPYCNFSRLYSLRVRQKISQESGSGKIQGKTLMAQIRTQRRGSKQFLLQP